MIAYLLDIIQLSYELTWQVSSVLPVMTQELRRPSRGPPWRSQLYSRSWYLAISQCSSWALSMLADGPLTNKFGIVEIYHNAGILVSEQKLPFDQKGNAALKTLETWYQAAL